MELKTKNILDGNSPVNRYKVMCLEQSGNGRTPDRISLAFKVLDDLVPNLGVYTKIFKRLREDFFDAVFSDKLTGKSQSDNDEFIQRIPFFSLISQVFTAQDLKADELTDQLETVKERLFDKHKQFEKSQSHVGELKHGVSGLKEDVRILQSDVQSKVDEIDDLQLVMSEEAEKAINVQNRLEGDINELQEALEEARGEIDFLQQYKTGYDNLQDAFSENMECDYEAVRKTKPVISTKRANLISSIQSAQRLEQQLLSVLNTSIEEFDVFLEEHKQILMEKELHDELTESEMVLQEIEIDQADQQLHQMQLHFKDGVEELSTELSLTRKHITMLQEQLQVLEENKPTLQGRDERRMSSDRRTDNSPDKIHREESVLSAGLDQDSEDDEMMDPFIPQERVFSKYAAMLYSSSNGGRTFNEFKDAHFCASCGEKTVVCPHKLGHGDRVMILPPGCTHIKVSRPNVRINMDIVGALLKPEGNFELAPSTAESKLRRYHPVRGLSRDNLVTPATPGSVDTLDSPILGGTESALIQPMNRLWDDYKRRSNLERDIPRPIPMDRTISLTEQFLSQLLWQDDFSTESDGYYSINDNLYRFMKERYIDEDVMYLATHDFLSSIIEYQHSNKMIQLLCHVLVGNLDSSCLRYSLLMADFITSVDWRDVEDFRAFTSVIYPFLNEDDLESLQMSYTSFSENKISPQLVSWFIINIILKYREPRFLHMESKLSALQTQDSGLISETEFIEMMDNLLPLSNDKLRRRLFWETERHVRMDGQVDQAPLLRVAQIASYLSLLQITQVVRDTVSTRVEEYRERPNSAGSMRKSGQDTQLVTSGEKLLTNTDLKNLGANIARRVRHRDRRLHLDEDW